MKEITVYTDGACKGNPGPGGWAAILMYNGNKKEIAGGEPQTTNNRMELTAVIRALDCLKEPCSVEIYSDSKYVIDGIEKGWAESWKKRGWKKSDKSPALNPDLWDALLQKLSGHKVSFHWVKGHDVNEYNNRCDELAVEQSLIMGRKHIMKHHILAKYTSAVLPEEKDRLAAEIFDLFDNTRSIKGISSVEVHKNCVDRDNRYDIMIVIEMERESLPEYDSCEWHRIWKDKYGPLLEKKAIFDCE